MIFGFGHSNLGLIISRCYEAVGKSNVQLVTMHDQLIRRRCYIFNGVDLLTTVRLRLLNKTNSVLIVVDALPLLRRIEGIEILDAPESLDTWSVKIPKFAKLFRALRSKPKPLKVVVLPDTTLKKMIVEIKERSILDSVLSAAKTMQPSDRVHLYSDLALHLVGRLSLDSFCVRAESRGASGRSYEKMLGVLKDQTAKRLGKALKAYQKGGDVTKVAEEFQVSPSELRFLKPHLRVKK